MSVRLIESLATTGPLAELFSDRSILQTMLEFEVALARVEAGLGIVPQAAVGAIQAAAKPTRLTPLLSPMTLCAQGHPAYRS